MTACAKCGKAMNSPRLSILRVAEKDTESAHVKIKEIEFSFCSLGCLQEWLDGRRKRK